MRMPDRRRQSVQANDVNWDLIAVHDIRRSKPIDDLVQRLDAEVGLQRVRDPPRQNHPGMPVRDRHKTRRPTAHVFIG
jgi:hypothetical protein